LATSGGVPDTRWTVMPVCSRHHYIPLDEDFYAQKCVSKLKFSLFFSTFDRNINYLPWSDPGYSQFIHYTSPVFAGAFTTSPYTQMNVQSEGGQGGIPT
jgi:hypothetical protein